MRTGGFELGSSALTSSTLKWLHRIQCGFNWQFQVLLFGNSCLNETIVSVESDKNEWEKDLGAAEQGHLCWEEGGSFLLM
jgi:hypothetical protein